MQQAGSGQRPGCCCSATRNRHAVANGFERALCSSQLGLNLVSRCEGFAPDLNAIRTFGGFVWSSCLVGVLETALVSKVPPSSRLASHPTHCEGISRLCTCSIACMRHEGCRLAKNRCHRRSTLFPSPTSGCYMRRVTASTPGGPPNLPIWEHQTTGQHSAMKVLPCFPASARTSFCYVRRVNVSTPGPPTCQLGAPNDGTTFCYTSHLLTGHSSRIDAFDEHVCSCSATAVSLEA